MGAEREAEFLAKLAKRRLRGVLALVEASAGQRPLTGMRAQLGGPPRDQDAGTWPVLDDRDRDGGGAPALELVRAPVEVGQPPREGVAVEVVGGVRSVAAAPAGGRPAASALARVRIVQSSGPTVVPKAVTWSTSSVTERLGKRTWRWLTPSEVQARIASAICSGEPVTAGRPRSHDGSPT